MGDIANQIYAARYESVIEEGFEKPAILLLTQDIYDQLEKECHNFILRPSVNKPATIFGMRIKVIHLNKGDC